jgi:tetrahydromethanopterin S-methyltransferase subunit G
MAKKRPDPEQLRARIAKLEKRLEDVKRDWRQLRWGGLGVIVALPAGLMFGWVAALVVTLIVAATFLTTFYLTRGYRIQYTHDIGELRRRLEEAEGAPAEDAAAS